MTTTVLLVRHGQSVGNVQQLFCGHDDTPLTETGIAQAMALGARLANTRIDAAYASDLSRAADTARHALNGREMTVGLDQRLREMHYGEWEGLSGATIRERNADHLREFFRGKVPAPGGETIMQVRARTAASVRDIAARHQDATVLVASHGNAIMALLAELLGVPEESSWSFAVNNTSLSTLHFSKSGRFTLVGFNDDSHAKGKL
jgi:broad specificity phosphatase PhoE